VRNLPRSVSLTPANVTLHEQPVTVLTGVGPALAEKLARLGIHTIIDLLFHLPLRYQDRTRVHAIGGLQVGQQVVVQGVVELTDVVFRGRRTMLCQISDDTGILTLRFFYFSNAQKARLTPGTVVRCFGEVRFGGGKREMIHPEYQIVEPGKTLPYADSYTPQYPTTEGLQQGRLRTLIGLALRQLEHTSLPDWVPSATLAEMNYPDVLQAVQFVHQPPTSLSVDALNEGTHPAQRRLAFDELIAHQLSLRLLRERLQSDPTIALPAGGEQVQAFRCCDCCKVTSDQEKPWLPRRSLCARSSMATRWPLWRQPNY